MKLAVFAKLYPHRIISIDFDVECITCCSYTPLGYSETSKNERTRLIEAHGRDAKSERTRRARINFQGTYRATIYQASHTRTHIGHHTHGHIKKVKHRNTSYSCIQSEHKKKTTTLLGIVSTRNCLICYEFT